MPIKVIVFTGGGTLGSVTPLLATVPEIRRRDPSASFLWIGTDHGPEEKIVRAAGLDFIAISSGKLRRYVDWRNLTDLARISSGTWQARQILRSVRASIVVSAGGYVAVPVVWAASTNGVPVHIHQMDIRPGLANRMSEPFAKSVSVAYEKSLSDFPRLHAVWTGNPVRPELFTGDRAEAMRLWGLRSDAPIVLVSGGGTGAIGLNRLVCGSLARLEGRVQVLHLTGHGKSVPNCHMNDYHPMEFIGADLRHAFAAADLVVTRAGMGSLTELAALGKPTIIVPMPDSHQEDNAAFFGDRAAACIISEKTTSPDEFADAVLGLLNDDGRRMDLATNIAALNRKEAATLLADMILAGAK